MLNRLFPLMVVLVTTRSAYGLEDFLGLPVDYDEKHTFDNFLSDWNEQDIWNDGPVHQDNTDDSNIFLKKLCQNYRLVLDNKELDCESLLIKKVENAQPQHVLHKRAADEVTPEEGSGEAEHEEHTPEEEKLIPINATPQTDTEDKEKSVTEADASKKEEVPTADIKPEDSTSEESKPVVVIGPPAEQPAIPTVHEEVVITEANKDNTEPPKTAVDETVTGSDKVDAAKPEESPAASEKETDAVEETGSDKKGKKLQASPDDLAEEVSPNQSANTIDETMSNAEELEKNVPKTKIKAASIANVEEPKSGESSETTGQGRKDTRILIGLFVAVVAVGSAAFVYNYVRKKKRNDNRTQNGVAKSDIEEGREMKPLMKTPQQPHTSDYKDESTSEVKS